MYSSSGISNNIKFMIQPISVVYNVIKRLLIEVFNQFLSYISYFCCTEKLCHYHIIDNNFLYRIYENKQTLNDYLYALNSDVTVASDDNVPFINDMYRKYYFLIKENQRIRTKLAQYQSCFVIMNENVGRGTLYNWKKNEVELFNIEISSDSPSRGMKPSRCYLWDNTKIQNFDNNGQHHFIPKRLSSERKLNHYYTIDEYMELTNFKKKYNDISLYVCNYANEAMVIYKVGNKILMHQMYQEDSTFNYYNDYGNLGLEKSQLESDRLLILNRINELYTEENYKEAFINKIEAHYTSLDSKIRYYIGKLKVSMSIVINL